MKTTHEPKRLISKRLQSTGREQGIALVTTLLLLTLLSAMTVGMVLAASSDELVNGYYRNIRGSFYSADSGLNVVRQAMLNQLTAAVPVTITNRAVQPISTSTASTIVSAMNSGYGSNISLNSGQAANSWPGKYRLLTMNAGDLALASCTPQGSAGVSSNCASPCTAGGTACAPNITGYQYNYSYKLSAVGETRASELTTLSDRGNLLVNIAFTGGAPVPTSFAAWGMFIDQYAICSGSYLVPGTISGPVFTNGAWTFGTSGAYIFTDPVGAVNANLGYQFSAGCYQSPNDPYIKTGSGGGTIDPNFQAGYSLGQNPVPLPGNDYSQKQAVLDGIGALPACSGVSTPCPAQAALGAVLKKIVATDVYPSSGPVPSTGVYLPYQTTAAGCGSVTPPCMVGGGMYIQGNAGVTLTASTTDSDAEIYTIVQGSTTTTVTVDLSANTTTIAQSGQPNKVLNGVPTQYDTGSPPAAIRDAAMVYVNGSISSLKGPGGTGSAIQDGHAMTVVASSNVVITDDITYKTKPVTTSQNQIPGTPPATLIPGNDNGQVLGIYTNGGNIQLNNAGNSTLDIQASLAAISSVSGSTNTLVNTGSAINTLNIMGGRIQNTISNINTTTRNVYFDRRFSQGGFAPPWFPSTTVTPTGGATTVVTPTTSRFQWLNQTPF